MDCNESILMTKYIMGIGHNALTMICSLIKTSTLWQNKVGPGLIIIKKSTQREYTSSAKAAHFPHTSQIPDLVSQHGESDYPKILIICSLYHCTTILNISAKSAHNLLGNGQINDWAISMVIWIAQTFHHLFLLSCWTPP